jgi:hypothetical protein
MNKPTNSFRTQMQNKKKSLINSKGKGENKVPVHIMKAYGGVEV